MYCKRCGKQMSYDAPMCKDCAEKVKKKLELNVKEEKGVNKSNLKRGIISVIAGFFAIIVGYANYKSVYWFLRNPYGMTFNNGSAIFLVVLGLVLCATSIAQGVIGICKSGLLKESNVKSCMTVLCRVFGIVF